MNRRRRTREQLGSTRRSRLQRSREALAFLVETGYANVATDRRILPGQIGLIVTGNRGLRKDMRGDIKDLRGEVGELRERMAHLEGLLEGLREAITGRTAAS